MPALQELARQGLLDLRQRRPARVLSGAAERADGLLRPVSQTLFRKLAILMPESYRPLIQRPFYAALVAHITREAEKKGLQASAVWWPMRDQLAVATSLTKGAYDAAIYLGNRAEYMASVFLFLERHFPLLVYNYSYEFAGLVVPTVIEDLYGAAQKIADYLVKLGHHNLCLVGKELAPNERLSLTNGTSRGWMDYLIDHDLLGQCKMPVYLPFDYRVGMYDVLFRSVLQSSERPTAIVFAHSPWAKDFLLDPELAQWKVPDELSLATFEVPADIPVTPDHPSLTYIDINYARTAECIVEAVQKMLAGDPHPPTIRVRLDLNVTESVGPAP